jgi:hypothetical protein
MAITRTELFSVESINSLIVEPVFNQSVSLSSGLQRLQTSATSV